MCFYFDTKRVGQPSVWSEKPYLKNTKLYLIPLNFSDLWGISDPLKIRLCDFI